MADEGEASVGRSPPAAAESEGGQPDRSPVVPAAGLGTTVAGDLTSLTPSQEIGSMASVLAALARTEPLALAPGTLIADQYRIERPIGEGGMGMVFLARDIRLDREVAVKVCTGLSRSAVHRIQREAMALAKLAHPNVVVVFQAGELDHRFFIVMECVAGGTARDWLAAAPRRPREIVALYLAAGAGLAAAHAAGLVHRDFKPDNVLVGVDGRPRVADFGLVRAAHDGDGEPPIASISAAASLVTQVGTVMGTPAYMSPEQRAGAVIDARADQYSFAASLWEALMGWRPDEDGTRGDVPHHVPSHVVAALRRALAHDPEDRWPELATLLAELRRDPAARRHRLALGAAALGLTAVVAAVAVATAQRGEPPCEDGAARIAEIWDVARRDALAGVVGEPAWPAIEQRIRARVDAWVDVYGQACRATRVDAVADEVTLYRRMLCLESRRDALDAALGALESGSRIAAANAAAAIDLLPVSDGCLDPDAGDPMLLPDDPLQRVEVAAAQRAVTEARAAALDPAALDPRGKAERAVSQARATGWAPVIAEALVVLGAVADEERRFGEAVALYEEATHLALASGRDALAVQALSDSAWPLATLERISEAKLALTTARALWERAGEPSVEERRILGAEAHVALYDYRPQDALTKTREQIALSERDVDAPATVAATNQFNLAIALEQVGELSEATRAAARAVELACEGLGDEHPTVARYRALGARIARQRGDFDAAIELATRSLEVDERWFGPDDLRLGVALDTLGDAAWRQGRFDEAEAFYQRHLEIRRRHDADADAIPQLEANLAIVAVEQGDLARAAPMAVQALASLERRHGVDDPALIPALVLTGYIARVRPEPDLAASERDFVRALVIAEARLGPDHTDTINLEIELANTQVAAGEAARAVERLERRLVRLPGLELPGHQPPEVRYALARALATTGETTRACALAAAAEAGMPELQIDGEPVAQWRAKRCLGATRR